MEAIGLRRFWLLATGFCALGTFVERAESAPCESWTFEGSRYVVCTVEPDKANLRLFWKNSVGEPYRSFSNLAEAVSAKGETLVFAMNAGMYSDAYAPIGLYIEDSQDLLPANTSDPKTSSGVIPNFYKKPNGVFFLDQDGGHILPTEKFLARRLNNRQKTPRFATQSGPMLVIGGKLHPALIKGSTDRTRRSGVGVCSAGRVRFAVSDDDVNFHDFARLFRDDLKCPNALFLDGGNGVGLYSPDLDRNDRSWHGGYGPMFALVDATGNEAKPRD